MIDSTDCGGGAAEAGREQGDRRRSAGGKADGGREEVVLLKNQPAIEHC